MIRGAIEVAQKTRVAGWIFSASETLRDKTVLAFVAGRCVGSGKVDHFRQDLLDAKLGDGYCGFDFAVRLADGEHVGSLIVRLQFSDMALIQSTSRIAGDDDEATGQAGPDLGAIRPESVSWMMDRGMLEQPEYDFLKAIQSAGAYERGLRTGKRGAATPDSNIHGRLDAETLVAEMLSLFALSEVRVVRQNTPAVSELVANPAALRRAPMPVVALWSQDRGRILLEERSHLSGRAASGPIAEPLASSIEYGFGPDRLLFLHRDCRFTAKGTAPASGVTVFVAAPLENHATIKRPAQIRAA
jgi:hypothetical protein